MGSSRARPSWSIPTAGWRRWAGRSTASRGRGRRSSRSTTFQWGGAREPEGSDSSRGANVNLRELLRGRETILLDGAMGTQLAAAGFDQGGEQCLLHPDAVDRIHKSYIEAGCRGIITNTLTMNRIFLSSHGRAVDPAEV